MHLTDLNGWKWELRISQSWSVVEDFKISILYTIHCCFGPLGLEIFISL